VFNSFEHKPLGFSDQCDPVAMGSKADLTQTSDFHQTLKRTRRSRANLVHRKAVKQSTATDPLEVGLCAAWCFV
jgi:hypothetical protein